nr:unnamed protein product [Callosobruchus chinensis]
MSSLQVIKMWS